MSLEELENKIKAEIPFIDKKPFSHNIIGLCLSEIATKYGDYQARATIAKFKLDKKGWKI